MFILSLTGERERDAYEYFWLYYRGARRSSTNSVIYDDQQICNGYFTKLSGGGRVM